MSPAGPVGSLSRYQLSHTKSNFDVVINIDSVASHDNHIQGIESFPRFLLQYQGDSDEHDLSNEKKDLSGNWMKITSMN